MKMKVWKGYHHLNGACLPKAETEENVKVLQSAETIYKRLILNVFQLPADTTFVKKIMMTKLIMPLHYKYTILSNCYMIKKVLLVLEIIVLYPTFLS